MPEIDCYTHFVNWIQYLEFQLQRPIDASDYVFPAIASTGKLKFGEPLSRAGFESIMEQIVDNSGIMIGRNGKFTTHCFRRGGAQYRFMWAEHKWSLKAVKWWGGWSSGEEVNTIMRYLLDELTSYEEGFSDIMMASRPSERHESFMATGTLQDTPFATEDQRKYPDRMLTEQTPRRSKGGTPQVLQPLPSLFQQLQSAQEAIPQTPREFRREPPTQLQPLPSLFPHLELDQDDVANAPMEMLAPQRSAADICDTYIQPTPPFHAIAPRIPKTSTMDDVIKYWTKGHPPQGLPGPLRDWPEQFERKHGRLRP
ncbi:phosphate system positive regulatory protein [Salix suchowensis]|nr:phosphate system positive regulatory protein [Salix suchowensis]